MPNLPDDQFERYLRQFRPLTPERLPFENRIQSRWRLRALAASAAFAGVMIAALLILNAPLVYPFLQPLSQRDVQRAAASQIEVPQPLTIRSADALLADAPSFKAVVDALALPSPTISFGVNQSALELLSKDSKP